MNYSKKYVFTLPGITAALMFACGPFMFATIGGRGLFLYLAILFALSIAVQAFFIDSKHALSLVPNDTVNTVITPFLLCLLWQLITFLWSPVFSFSAMYTYMKTVLFFVFLSLPKYTKADKNLILFAQTAVIVAATVILLTHGVTSSAGGATTDRLTFSFFGVEQDPNYLAFFFVAPFVALLSLTTSKNRRIVVRIGAVALMAFLSFGILSTGSRGALLGIAAAFIVFFARKTQMRPWKFLLLTLAAIALAIVLLKAVSTFLPESIADRFTLDNILENGGSGRTDIWKRYIDKLLKNPLYLLFGAGNSSSVSVNSSAAHNYILECWFEYGLVGVACLVFFFFVIFRSVLRVKNNCSFAIIISALVMSMFLSVSRMLPFWLCITLANILHLPEKDDSPKLKLKKRSAPNESQQPE